MTVLVAELWELELFQLSGQPAWLRCSAWAPPQQHPSLKSPACHSPCLWGPRYRLGLCLFPCASAKGFLATWVSTMASSTMVSKVCDCLSQARGPLVLPLNKAPRHSPNTVRSGGNRQPWLCSTVGTLNTSMNSTWRLASGVPALEADLHCGVPPTGSTLLARPRLNNSLCGLGRSAEPSLPQCAPSSDDGVQPAPVRAVESSPY